MNKKQAIKECKELWGEIKASGLSKREFLSTKQGRAWRAKEYESDCPFCELAGIEPCKEKCPLYIQYGEGCLDLNYCECCVCPPEWFETIEGLK